MKRSARPGSIADDDDDEVVVDVDVDVDDDDDDDVDVDVDVDDDVHSSCQQRYDIYIAEGSCICIVAAAAKLWCWFLSQCS
jgi:hypothetical protein